MTLVLPRIAATLALVASCVVAQTQFEEAAKRHLPRDSDNTLATVLGDVDGDGDLDLVCGNVGQNRLYLNDGLGRFTDVTATRMPTDDSYTKAAALGDVDGDGDLDLVFGNGGSSGRQNKLYLNNGKGAFTDATAAQMPTNGDSTDAVGLGDVDGDGDSDLVFANSFPRQNRLYLNDGRGTFTDVTAAQMPTDNDVTSAVVLGDVDGDGDCDLVFGNRPSGPSGQNRLYLNNGAGTFTDVTAARMPPDDNITISVALGDVDGDGNPDLVCGNGSFAGQQNRLYLNDGSGSFTDATAIRMPIANDDTHAAVPGDVDGDGDLDLVLGNGAFAEQQNRLYLNDGSGRFTDATGARLPADLDATNAVGLGDTDGDGYPEIVYANDGQNRLYFNDGAGGFTDASVARLPIDGDGTGALALGDVDGDGDLDLVCGNDEYGVGPQNRLYLNDGGGIFTDVTAARMPTYSDKTGAVVLGDVDGDGDLDLLIGNHLEYYTAFSSRNRLYLNDGGGTFTDVTAARMPTRVYDTRAMALGDVDGDGDLDLVCGNYTETFESPTGDQNRLYLNDGNGTFADATAARMPYSGGITTAVVLGDVDSDGDLDLVFGNTPFCFTYCTGGGQTVLLLNDGTGTFTSATSRMPTDGVNHTSAVVGADVDGDGDLDLVLGNGGGFYGGSPQNRLYVNDGTGTFTDATAAHMPPDGDATLALVVGDLDGDGDPDVICGNSGQQSRLYLNDGTGTFTDATAARMPVIHHQTQAVALGDTDGDGDPDLVFGNGDGRGGRQNRSYVNLVRQIDVPLLARPGHPYRLDVYARDGSSPGMTVAAVMLSTGAARIPFPPYGTFGLDPTRLLLVPPFGIPQSGGVQSRSFPVPDDPSLVGLSLYSQALLVQGSALVRLTNWTADQIVP